MRRFSIITILSVLLAFSIPVFGLTPGGTSAQFLKIPIGPRAEAMGGAFTGLADDGSAMFWNPAGIGQFDNARMVGGYIGYVARIKYEYFGAGFPISDKFRLGVGIGALNTPPMLRTSFDTIDLDGNEINNINGELGEEFSASDNQFILNLAYKFSRKFGEEERDFLYVGANVKYVREALDEYKDMTVVGDIGLLFKVNPKFRLGLAMQNIGGQLRFIKDKEKLPQTLRFGLSYYIVDNQYTSLIGLADVIKFNDEDVRFGIGSEFTFRDLISLRLGYKNADVGSLTAGLGIIVKFSKTSLSGEKEEIVRAVLNYSFIDYEDMGQTHRYGLSFRF